MNQNPAGGASPEASQLLLMNGLVVYPGKLAFYLSLVIFYLSYWKYSTFHIGYALNK